MSESERRDDRARVIDSERAYEGRLLKVDVDRLVLPGGKETTLETIRHPGAAAALPFLPDGSVVLVRQYRHAVGGFILEVPAGKLDPGESPEQCVTREVAEEAGYRPGRIEPLGSIYTTPGFTDEVIWLYAAHDLERVEQHLDEDEVLEPVTFSFEDAVAAVLDGRIRDTKSVAAILHAEVRRARGSASR